MFSFQKFYFLYWVSLIVDMLECNFVRYPGIGMVSHKWMDQLAPTLKVT